MTLTVKNSMDDYTLYLSEYSMQNRMNQILMYTGLLIMSLVAAIAVVNDFQMKTVQIVFGGIGALVYMIPRIHYYLDRHKLQKASYLDDVLSEHIITMDENHLIFKKGDDVFETRKRDVYQFYELDHFYVISINLLHHFPIPKSQLKLDQENFIRDYFELK